MNINNLKEYTIELLINKLERRTGHSTNLIIPSAESECIHSFG